MEAAETTAGPGEDERVDAAGEDTDGGAARSVDDEEDRGVDEQSTTTTVDGDTGFVGPELLGLSSQDLLDAADATLGLDRLRFELISTTTLPGVVTSTFIRSGWYDVQNDTGEGLMVFAEGEVSDEARDATVPEVGLSLGDLMDEVDGIRFEYRLVRPTVWQLISQPGSAEEWLGFDIEETMAVTGGNLESAIDGSILLSGIMDSLMLVAGVRAEDDGSTTWAVLLQADEVAPLAAGAGSSQRLYEAGFSGKTAISMLAELSVSPDGLVTGAEIDASEWWAEGTRVAAGVTEEVDMSVRMDLVWAEADPLPAPVAPCDAPEVDDSDGLRVLLCNG